MLGVGVDETTWDQTEYDSVAVESFLHDTQYATAGSRGRKSPIPQGWGPKRQLRRESFLDEEIEC